MKKIEDITVKKLLRIGKGWCGGLTIMPKGDKYTLYGVNDKSGKIGMMDPHTGAYLGTLETDLGDDIKDISWDRGSFFWCSAMGDKYHKLSVSGGNTVQTIGRPKHGFGIFCDHNEDNVLWCTALLDNKVIKKSLKDGSILKEIKLSFSPKGIARSGEYLWITKDGGGEKTGKLFKVDMDGNILETFEFPESTYSASVAGMCINQDGYLWVYGGLYTSIYKLDINNAISPTPDPPPPPTPETDEDKEDFLRLIIKFIRGIFNW